MLKQQLKNKVIRLTCRANKLCMLLFFCGILLNTISCTEEVDFDWPIEEQKYVIGCLFCPDNKIEFYAFKTTPILEDSIPAVNNLNIVLYENDSVIWSGSKSDAGRYSIPIQPKPATKYAVSVSNNQSISINASDTIPLPVYILSANYVFPVYEDLYGSKFGQISLSFRDKPDIKNFYEIIILNRDSSIQNTFNVKSPVITLDNENDPISPGSLLFTDELFEGKTLTLNINVSSYDDPIVVLKNVSRSYYEYRNSIIAHLYNQNTERDDVYNLFKGDPVELYSNVNNALGIFAGFTQDIKTCSREN